MEILERRSLRPIVDISTLEAVKTNIFVTRDNRRTHQWWLHRQTTRQFETVRASTKICRHQSWRNITLAHLRRSDKLAHRPTTPIFSPPLTLTEIPLNTLGRPGRYAILTSLNSTAPCSGHCAEGFRSSISWGASWGIVSLATYCTTARCKQDIIKISGSHRSTAFM